ncbi:MAG: protease modulator HflK [Planctomycetota bacterium]
MTRARVAAAIAALALAGLGALSVFTVDSAEQAVIERFGRASRDVLPGIHLKLPWPIEKVRRVDVMGSRQMPLGYRLIDELNGIEPTERRKQWLTADTNIVELKATVLYRVSSARDWLYGMSGVHAIGDGRMESHEFALRRVGDSALTDIVAELDIDQVLASGLALVPAEARRRIQAEADRLRLGVAIDEVQLLDSKPPINVRRAFTDVENARQERQRLIDTARFRARTAAATTRTAANRIVKDEEKEAERILAEARGEAAAFAELAAAVGDAGSEAALELYFERVKAILAAAELRTIAAGTPEAPTPVFLEEN